MVTGSAGERGAQVGSLAKPERRGLSALRLFGHKLSPLAQIGLAIIAINLLVALFAPWIAPYDQAAPVGDSWADPDIHHWLGLDNLGRDLLSRPRDLLPGTVVECDHQDQSGVGAGQLFGLANAAGVDGHFVIVTRGLAADFADAT